MRNSITDFAIVVILGIGFVLAFRRETEDPEWESRWLGLGPADRSRIKAAARSGSLLAEPAEIELAAGFARYDRRRLGIWELGAVILTLAGLALIAAGLVADSVVFLIGGFVFVARGLWLLRLELQRGRNLRETLSRNHRP